MYAPLKCHVWPVSVTRVSFRCNSKPQWQGRCRFLTYVSYKSVFLLLKHQFDEEAFSALRGRMESVGKKIVAKKKTTAGNVLVLCVCVCSSSSAFLGHSQSFSPVLSAKFAVHPQCLVLVPTASPGAQLPLSHSHKMFRNPYLHKDTLFVPKSTECYWDVNLILFPRTH